MSSLQDQSDYHVVKFNRLMQHLAGTVVEENRCSREIIRRMWSSKLLNIHVTGLQSRFGLTWLKEILVSDFRTDGNYEKSITELVRKMKVWPDSLGVQQQLTTTEETLIKY